MAGVQAGSAGRLSIEIVAEVARLTQDLQRIKSAVNAASADIAKNARAANDNLAAIGSGAGAGMKKFSQDVQAATEYMNRLARSSTDVATRINALTGVTGGMRRSADDISAYGVEMDRLRAKYNPMFSTVQQYRQSLEEIRRAHAVGAISAEEMGAAISRERQQALASISALKGRDAALRQSAQAAAEAAKQQSAYAAQANALRAQIDPMFAAQQRFNQQMDLAEDLYRANAITAREYAAAQQLAREALQQHAQAAAGANKVLDRTPGMMQQVTSSAGAQRAGMQQLSYQIGDVAQQFAVGTAPMAIFAQQGGQVVQAIQLMTNSSKGFIGFLAGPWGAALMGAGMILGALGAAYFKAKDETEKAEKAQRSFTEVLEGSKSSWKEVTAAAKAYADQQEDGRKRTVRQIAAEADAIKSRIKLAISTRQLLQTELERHQLRMDIAQTGEGAIAAAALRQLSGVDAKIEQNKKAILELHRAAREMGVETANAVASLADPATKVSEGFEILRQQARGSIRDVSDLTDRLAELNTQERQALEAMRKTHEKTAETLKLSKVTGQEIARILGTTVTSGLRTAAQNRAAKGAANSYHLTGQAIDIPLTVNGRPLTKEGIRRELEKAGIIIKELLGPGDKNHNDHFHIAFDVKRAGPDVIRRAQEEAAKVSEAAARKAQEVAQRHADWWEKMLVDWHIDLLTAVHEAVTAINDAEWESFNRRVQADVEQPMLEAARAAEILSDRVNALHGAFGSIRGMGPLGDVFGVLTSRDPTAALLNMGGLGTLLGLGTKGGQEAYAKQREAIRDGLVDVFGPKASGLAETMSSLLQGAGTGAMVGQAAFGGSKAGQLGASIGGAIGQVAGTKFLGMLGSAAGPIGAIAGSLLGGVLGGLLGPGNRTARAHLTGADQISVGGKDRAQYGAAGDLGGAVLEGLNRIADAFGATVGSFSTAIGVRGDQIRVNTDGTSLKFKNGAQGFGEDSAAAIKAAIEDAISDGVFQGLSAGVERLLKGEGDIEKQLQKALSFQGVFDELKQLKDPQGAELEQLDKWRKGMDEIFAEAGATAEELAKLEELTGLKRTAIVEKYSEDIAAAEDIARDKRLLEIEIMRLEGKDLEALAAARAIEKAEANAGLHPLMDRIYALQDEAAATAEAARVAEEAAQLARSRREFEIEIMRLMGDETGAVAAQREIERAALHESLRPLYDHANALRDQAAAAQKAAEETARLKAAQDQLLAARHEVELQILDLTDKELALRIRREDEVRAADESVRALLLHKFALEDQALAAAKAAEEAEKLAAAQKAIADERYGLETRYLQLVGDEAELRRRQLAETDPANREYLQKIFDMEDALEAQKAAQEAAEAAQRAYSEALEAHARAVEDARNVLSQAYERESSALQGTADKFRDFAKSIREFREGLVMQANPNASLQLTQARYLNTAALARGGNEEAMGRFTGDAQAYIDAARSRAGSATEFARVVATVLGQSSSLEGNANSRANAAERQLKAMEDQVRGILDLNEKVISFADALRNWTDVQSQEVIPMVVETVTAGVEQVGAKIEASAARAEKAQETVEQLLVQLVVSNNSIERKLANASDGDAIRTRDAA